jgi:hypothetical protein
MKILKSVLLATILLTSVSSFAQDGKASVQFEMPLKTAIIKDPAAQNATQFLPATQLLKFWVYKAGSTEDVKKMTEAFSGDKDIKAFTEGQTTGDYKEFTLELKNKKELRWFEERFKKAGIAHIKVNNGAIENIDKL